MQTLLKLVKTFLITLLVLNSLGCNKLPPFPNWNPVLVIPSKGKAFHCKIVDAEKLLFQCDAASFPISQAGLDGGFCSNATEMNAVIQWGRDAKTWVDAHCPK